MRKRWIVTGLGVATIAALAAVTLSAAPRVAAPMAPRSETAVQVRSLYKRLLEFKTAPDDLPVLDLPEVELNAALRIAGHVLPGLRAEGRITEQAVTISASLPLPGGFWINANGDAVPSSTGFMLANLRIGHLPLPPQATLAAAVALGDVLLGGGAASEVMAAIEPIRLEDGHAAVSMALPLPARDALTSRFDATMRRFAVPFDTGPTERLLDRMAAAERAGTLRNAGSLVPWLRFALREAPDGGTAILALAIACGDEMISQALGWRAEEHAVACHRTMLEDRRDLRQHFVVSAGLEVATTLGSADAVGELKELYDSRPRGSGFSFDDLAANRAGIAFARLILGTDSLTRSAIADRLTREAAILPSIERLDSGLTAAQFVTRYRDIDSPAYAAAIADIDRRIAGLALYRDWES